MSVSTLGAGLAFAALFALLKITEKEDDVEKEEFENS